MGGFFGVASKEDCTFDLFFGTDYHSHLGTRRAGMAVYGKKGFNRAIHNIENSPFRTKFDRDMKEMEGTLGIGIISDFEPQPLIIRSHHGTYAIATVGKINNADDLIKEIFAKGNSHFLEMSGGDVNPTELTAALINQADTLEEGIHHAQRIIRGSLSLLVMTTKGIYAARDLLGRTPIAIGRKEDSWCACFESFSYLNLGYETVRELGPGEVVFMTPEGIEDIYPAQNKMRICTFLWIYYGYPPTSYEGISVEKMRNNCGAALARRDMARGIIPADSVAGIPDSGIAHAIGYSNTSGIPYNRPFIKYTPTWPRSFMPTVQSKRDFIARMKLIPIPDMVRGKRLILIDDSIVRGTQLNDKTEFLFANGARECHIRPACPPIVYGCKYLSFSRSTSEMELIARRMMKRLEGTSDIPEDQIRKYTDPDSPEYAAMLEEIRRELNFTSLHYNRLDDMIEAVGVNPCKLCTYCWNGQE